MTIKREGNKFKVLSESGKNLGTFDSESEAEKRLRQIEFFKNREHGGPVAANQPVVVGEAGPEVFVPTNAGTVISNKEVKRQQLANKQFGLTDRLMSGVLAGFSDDISGAANVTADAVVSVFTGDDLNVVKSFEQGKREHNIALEEFDEQNPILGPTLETLGYVFSASKLWKAGKTVLGFLGNSGRMSALGATNAAGNNENILRGAATGALVPILTPGIKAAGTLIRGAGRISHSIIENIIKKVVGTIVKNGGSSGKTLGVFLEKPGAANFLLKHGSRLGFMGTIGGTFGLPAGLIAAASPIMRASGSVMVKANHPLAVSMLKELSDMDSTLVERTLILNLFGVDVTKEDDDGSN